MLLFLKDTLLLFKPRIVLLVTFTSLVPVFLFSYDEKSFYYGCITSCAILLCSAGSSALNMSFEKITDTYMKRTAGRPIPSGRLSIQYGICIGIIMSILGCCIAFFISFLSGIILLVAFLTYAFVYTAGMKPLGVLPNFLGGFPGALPPVITHLSMTDDVILHFSFYFITLFLFFLIVLWSCVHSWAIFIYLYNDYAKSYFPVLPIKKNIHYTSCIIYVFCIGLSLCTIWVFCALNYMKNIYPWLMSIIFSIIALLLYFLMRKAFYLVYYSYHASNREIVMCYAKNMLLYSLFFIFLICFILFFLSFV